MTTQKRPAGIGANPDAVTGATSSYGLRPTDLTLDDIAAAHRVGFDLGFAEGRRFADEDRARAILHAFACEMAGVTRRLATANYGPAWADLVCGDDE